MRPPNELLECKDIVAPKNIKLQSDVAYFIIDLKSAYDDCKYKLNQIKGYYK